MSMLHPTLSACLALCWFSTPALAADWYASASGAGDGSSPDAPSSVSAAVNNAEPGDTVYLRGGTYTGWSASVRPVRSGTAEAWITFAAFPGELPIFEGSGVGSGTHEYIRYVGLVARNGSSGGFGNGWTDGDCSTMSNSHLEYINVIADNNAINGIAHYCATGLHIKQSIVAHNGNQEPSWSSGVNLFAVQGSAADNLVEQTISFENLDISEHHSDGSGFILDQNSTGATFLNNVGFRNGGSCIRVTNSTNIQLIHNTCVHNGQDPTALYHDEIFFSDTNRTHEGALLHNNLCIPTDGQRGLTMGDGVTAVNNEFAGTDSMVGSVTGDLDFHLTEGSSPIDRGAEGAPSPAEDIGFDWRCIKQDNGQVVSWWAYAVDYDYIASIGGVAACFAPQARSGAPDQGAHEFGGSVIPSVGGATGEGGAPGEGGANPQGGAVALGGAPGEGGANPQGGAVALGSAPGEGGANPQGGAVALGGASGEGGANPQGGAVALGGAPGEGGAPNGGIGGGSATVGGGGGGNTSTPRASAEPAGRDGGCGCAMANRGPQGWFSIAITAFLLGLFRRRQLTLRSARSR